MYRIGSGFIGTKQWEITSGINTEIIESPPPNWSTKFNLYKFSFINPEHDCTVIINNKFELFIPAGRGFNTEEVDAPIWSFVIKQSGVKYSYIGAY